jgi:hypothetical protein
MKAVTFIRPTCDTGDVEPVKPNSSPGLQNRPREIDHSGKASLRRRCLVFSGLLLAAQSCSQPIFAASETPLSLEGSFWNRLTGVPDDLYYPQFFLGKWNVESVLMDVNFPNGPEAVADASAALRAEKEDKGRIIKYSVLFIEDGRGHVVSDRRFNTASLLSLYTAYNADELSSMVEWDVKNPGRLNLRMPTTYISSRVSKRWEDASNVGADRLETSEFMEQVFDIGNGSKVKAFQTFTKYHWRDLDKVIFKDSSEIVAAQVVSEFDPERVALDKSPSVVWRYKMQFTRSTAI